MPPFPDFGEHVFPTASQNAPYALPTGWHCGSAQSMRPLQLLSLPSLHISRVPPGHVEQVDGEVLLQVWPEPSQTMPMQAGWPQDEQELLGTEQVLDTESQT